MNTLSVHHLARDCPRYEFCDAAYCPFAGGLHLKNEPTCHWLRMAVKIDGEAFIRATLRGDMAEAILGTVSRLLSQRSSLAYELRRAARAPSKTAPRPLLQPAVAA